MDERGISGSQSPMEFSRFYASPRFRAKYLRALESLSVELNETWKRVFPADARWPRDTGQAFFEPFAKFGVALYDACAEEMLTSTPSHNHFLHILDFDLKTFVCDRIHPYREKPIRSLQDALDTGARGEFPGEWMLRMGEAWREFEHPRHNANHERVYREFIDLYTFQPVWWGQLIEGIHKAISKRAIHWLVEHAEIVVATAESGASPVTRPPTAAGSVGSADSNEVPPPAPMLVLDSTRIRKWIAEEGYDNKTLAERLGTSPRTVS